jgi:hypothetical protein
VNRKDLNAFIILGGLGSICGSIDFTLKYSVLDGLNTWWYYGYRRVENPGIEYAENRGKWCIKGGVCQKFW